jgi:hypothetical protein
MGSFGSTQSTLVAVDIAGHCLHFGVAGGLAVIGQV